MKPHMSVALLFAAFPLAMSAQPAPRPPLPLLLTTSRNAILVNAGGIDNLHAHLAYDAFYSSLGQWSRFRLTTSVPEADLVFELSAYSRIPSITWGSGIPILTLNIRDARSQTLVWSLNEPVRGDAGPEWLSAAVQALVDDFKGLLADASSNPEASKQALPNKK